MSNLFLIVFGRSVSVVISLVMGKVLTTMIPMNDVGLVLTFSSSCVLISYMLVAPIGQYINRNAHKFMDYGMWPSVFKKYNLYLLLIGIPTVFSYYLFFKFNSSEVNHPLFFAFLVAMFVYFSTWNQTIPPTLNLLGQTRKFVALSTLSQSLYFSFSLALILIFERSALFWILGGVLGYALSFLINFVLFQLRFILRAEIETEVVLDKKKILQFSSPIALTSVLTWVQTHFYRIFLLSLFGSAMTAKVGVFMSLGLNLMTSLEIILGQLLYPRFYKSITIDNKENRSTAWTEVFEKSAGIYISASFLGIGASPFLTRILTGEAFYPYYNLLLFAIVAELARCLFNLFSLRAMAEYSTSKLILPQVFATLILGIGFFIIYFKNIMQLQAIPILIIISNITALIGGYWSLKKSFDLKINWKSLMYKVMISAPYLFLIWLWPLNDRIYFYCLLPIFIIHFIWMNKELLQSRSHC